MHVHTEESIPAVEATCTHTGLTEGIRCSVCNTVLKQQEIVPALGHSWSGWIETKPSTCTAKGEEQRKCSRCTESENRETALKAHTPGGAADCTHALTCTVCGTKLVEKLGHDWEDWQVLEPSTCTSHGQEARTCKRCKTQEKRALELAEHTPGAEPDCTHDQVCTVCGEILAAKLGHSPGKAASCTTDQTCIRCNVVLTGKLGHDWRDWQVLQRSTCTTQGREVRACRRCKTAEKRYLDLAEHRPGEWKTLTSPTTTEEGEKIRQCTVCHQVVEGGGR